MHVIEIMDAAASTLKQRGQQNGYDQQEERSAGDIAAIYDALQGKVPLTTSAADAWLFLVSLKFARLRRQMQNGTDITDTVIDLVAYTALRGEELLKQQAMAQEKNDHEDAMAALWQTSLYIPPGLHKGVPAGMCVAVDKMSLEEQMRHKIIKQGTTESDTDFKKRVQAFYSDI